jgi:hypothetical protein
VKAKEVHKNVCKDMADLEASILPQLPWMPIPKSRLKHPPKVRFKINGEPSALAFKYFDDLLVLDAGSDTWMVDYPKGTVGLAAADYPLVTHETPTLGNQAFIKQHLQDKYKWKPEIWNYKKDASGKEVRVGKDKVKTSPRFNDAVSKELCDDLKRLGDKVAFVKDIIIWLTLRHRKNLLCSDNGTGLMRHPRLMTDGRLPASMDTLGANTGRVQHKGVANIPAVGKLYGKELRELFTVPRGKVMVGWDAKGLEDRVKANRTYKYDNGEFAEKVLDPEYDPHLENARIWDCDRSTAKSPYYALVYNCSEATFTRTLGCSKAEGQGYYQAFWDLNYGLRDLGVKISEYYQKNKFVKGLDNRKLKVRSEHSLSNLVFQSDGAIIMKRATVILMKKIKESTIHDKVNMVIWYHDELQFEAEPEAADMLVELSLQSMREAGEYYKSKVPFEADAQVGNNWAECH